MILLLDIGNSSTMVGLSDGKKITGHFKISSRNEDDYSPAIKKGEITELLNRLLSDMEQDSLTGAAICSVVPELTPKYAEFINQQFDLDAWILDHSVDLGIKVLVDEPAQAGPDRLANAVAVKELHGYPAVVVDLGTSTNFDVVNSRGDYIGGAIAPGVKTSSVELFRRASRLFPVEIEKPERTIGRNSAEAMKSGIFYGSLGLIDHITSLIITELDNLDTMVVATGGYAELFAEHSKYIQTTDPLLTLKGIAIAYDRNR